MWAIGVLPLSLLLLLASSTHAIEELRMQPCGKTGFLCSNKKMSRGILISAYGQENELHAAYDNLNGTIDFIRAHKSPSIPLALVTNDPHGIDLSHFDYLIRIREDLLVRGAKRNAKDYAPQWFTRLYYYGSSPFHITLAMDANAFLCNDVTPLFEAMEEFDFVAPHQSLCLSPGEFSSNPGHHYFPHNYAMMYRNTPATRALFDRWLLNQLQRGVPFDDQGTLSLALHQTAEDNPDIHIGELTSMAAASMMSMPSTPEYFPAASFLLGQRTPSVVHPFYRIGCDLFTYDASRVDQSSRVVAPLPGKFYHVSSMKECNELPEPMDCAFSFCKGNSEHELWNYQPERLIVPVKFV